MKPYELEQLLEAASRRPWKPSNCGGGVISPDGARDFGEIAHYGGGLVAESMSLNNVKAVVALGNVGELLCSLWRAVDDQHREWIEHEGKVEHPPVTPRVVRLLEALKSSPSPTTDLAVTP